MKTRLKSHELLLECNKRFEYRDGKVYWKTNAGNNKTAGKRAGTECKKSRRRFILINKIAYMEHHIVYILCKNVVPEEIDHIDGDSLNNKIENLRIASRAQNLQNRQVQKNSSTGFKGVFFDARRNKFFAKIGAFGKYTYLGAFESAIDAYHAYCEAAKKLHKEYART